MKKNAKFVAIILAAIFVLATMCLALVACNEDDKKGGLSAADWETVVTAFKEATGGTDEFDVIISNFSSFNFSDGKFTAGRIDLTNGVTLEDIVVELDETGAIELISYKKRTTDANTPDRFITVDANGVNSEDIPKPTDNEKMDEDEWNEQVEVFAQVTNYTLTRTRNGNNVGTMKIDGIKYYDSVDNDEAVIVPVDSKYYIYEKTKSQTTWTRSETTQSRYQSRVNFPRTLVTVAAAAITGGFEQFSFNAGVYTLEELYLEDYETTLRDIRVTVSGKAIVKAVCILVGGYDNEGDEIVTVDHVGSTVVTIPTNYIEPEAPPAPVGPQKMSETDWGNAIDNFIHGTNFTTYNGGLCSLSITRRTENGVYIERIGGDYDDVQNENRYFGVVYHKDGGECYKWTKVKPTDEWTCTPIGSEEYYSKVEGDAQYTEAIGAALVKSYSEFTLQDSFTYYAASIDVGAILTEVTIRVRGTMITEIGFTASNNERTLMTNFGNTDEYTPDQTPDISGTLFLCNNFIPGAGMPTDPSDPEDFAALMAAKEQYVGSRLNFEPSTGIFGYETGENVSPAMMIDGTWEAQDDVGSIIKVTITRVTENGEPQDMATLGTQEMYFIYNGFEVIQIIGTLATPIGFCIYEIY